MIRWTDRARSGSAGLATYASSCTYARLPEKYSNPVLFGSSISAFDVTQGSISDCYWITATSEVGDTPNRMRNIFIN